MRHRFDVLQVADFRFPGGSAARLADEIDAVARVGLNVGLLEIKSAVFKRGTAWNPEIVRTVSTGIACMPAPGDDIEADVVVLRYPHVLANADLPPNRVTAGRVILVLNQNLYQDEKRLDLEALDRHLEKWLGQQAEWWPIDNEIRRNAREFSSIVDRISQRDWWDSRIRHFTTTHHQIRIGSVDALIESSAGEAEGRARLEDSGASGSRGRTVVWLQNPETSDPNCVERDTVAAVAAGALPVLSTSAAAATGWKGCTTEAGDLDEAVRCLDSAVICREMSDSGRRSQLVADLLLNRLNIDTDHLKTGNKVIAQATPDGSPTIMFVTSNGAGMGHLTRQLGIARALGNRADPIFVSLSQGVPIVAGYGFDYEYVAFNSAMHAPTADWNRYFHARLSQAIDTFRPRLLVFDGIWPYRGLIDAIRSKSIQSVWVRRGMWKPSVPPDQLRRTEDFSLTIEPGDYASSFDTGATRQVDDAMLVGPITVLSEGEILSRDDARRELGLRSQGPLAIVTLGAGNINDISGIRQMFVDCIRSLGDEWEVAVTSPPIAGETLTSGAHVLKVFPLARYARAFDFAVSATGYNSFHEWINASIPTVWVPNQNTVTDNQVARARFAASVGAGINIEDVTTDSVQDAIQAIASKRARLDMTKIADGLHQTNGSWAAADAIIRQAVGMMG